MDVNITGMKVVKLDGGSDEAAERAADKATALFGQALESAGATVDPISLADARSRLRIVQSPLTDD